MLGGCYPWVDQQIHDENNPEPCSEPPVWYVDNDGDGFGTDQETISSCDPVKGFARQPNDCDDADPDRFPDAEEICDGLDSACGPEVVPLDEIDGDGDGFVTCDPWFGGNGLSGGDCDDANAILFPGAPELCDGLDNACQGALPADEADDDGDGWVICEIDGDGWQGPPIDGGGDCDDAEPNVNPSRVEVCEDGLDNNCDGTGIGCVLEGAIGLGNANAKLVGEQTNTQTGSAVSGAGDVNGDGYDDLLVGAHDWNSNEGAAYLVLSSPAGVASGPLTNADAKFESEAADDYTGWSISGAGDVNNDGFDDILVGAFRNDGAAVDAGAAYLMFGSAAGIVGGPLASADAKFTGEAADDMAGFSVSGAGDINDDGLDDILVGAQSEGGTAGAVYVVMGAYGLVDMSLASADAKLTGENPGDYAGYSVSDAGDLNGDAYDDVLVGAIYGGDLYHDEGVVYVVHGAQYGIADMSLADADTKLNGEATGDSAGAAVSSAGDVNGDGYADIMNGAFENDAGGNMAGALYVNLGAVGGISSMILTNSDTRITGAAESYTGWSVSDSGDLDGDGFDDVIMGAYNEFNGANGRVYLLYGSAAGIASGTLANAAAVLNQESAGDGAGASVSGAGDVDGDGYADILVGAPIYDSATGAAYLLLGGAM